jgi:hypothetical protein
MELEALPKTELTLANVILGVAGVGHLVMIRPADSNPGIPFADELPPGNHS